MHGPSQINKREREGEKKVAWSQLPGGERKRRREGDMRERGEMKERGEHLAVGGKQEFRASFGNI